MFESIPFKVLRFLPKIRMHAKRISMFNGLRALWDKRLAKKEKDQSGGESRTFMRLLSSSPLGMYFCLVNRFSILIHLRSCSVYRKAMTCKIIRPKINGWTARARRLQQRPGVAKFAELLIIEEDGINHIK